MYGDQVGVGGWGGGWGILPLAGPSAYHRRHHTTARYNINIRYIKPDITIVRTINRVAILITIVFVLTKRPLTLKTIMPPTNNAMCIRVCFFLNGMCSTLPACAPPYLRVLHHSCVCSTLPACAPPLLRVQAAPADQKNNSHYALVTEGVTYSTGEGSNILYDDTNCLCTNQSDCMNTTNALYGVSQGGGSKGPTILHDDTTSCQVPQPRYCGG